jgi:hypothetical protein
MILTILLINNNVLPYNVYSIQVFHLKIEKNIIANFIKNVPFSSETNVSLFACTTHFSELFDTEPNHICHCQKKVKQKTKQLDLTHLIKPMSDLSKERKKSFATLTTLKTVGLPHHSQT